jgi:transcription elongation factor Elf1
MTVEVRRVFKTVKCPMCNHIHGGTFSRRKPGKRKASSCSMCKGTQQVPMQVAQTYMEALNELQDLHLSGVE